MILDYSKQFNPANINSQVIVAGLSNPFPGNGGGFKASSTQVAGVVAGALGFGITNEFGTPLWSQAQQALSESVGGFQALASAAKQKITGKGFSNSYTLLNANQSVKTWTGSSLPVFNVPLKFVAFDEDDDVTQAHRALLSAVGPVFSEKNSLSAFIKPPLGYLPNGISASGTITVSVGQWFRASGQVMITVDMSYSKETLASGAPLYCEGTISFTPFRIVSLGELYGYFLD